MRKKYIQTNGKIVIDKT